MFFMVGFALSLIAAHLIAKEVDRKCVGMSKKWLAKLLPLIALLASFFAIAAIIIAILSTSMVGQGFSR